MKKIISFGLVSVFAFAGCTPIDYRPNQPTVEVNRDANVDVDNQLSAVAMSVQDSLLTLAATKEPLKQHAINTNPLTTPRGGMGFRATLDWTGPIEPLLYRLGEMTNYKLKVLGPTPAIPVVVSLVEKNRRIADIVKDAGLQAGHRANIVVYPSNRIIELRYIPA